MSYVRGQLPTRIAPVAKFTADLEQKVLAFPDLKGLWRFNVNIPDTANKVIRNLVTNGPDLVEHTAYSNLEIVTTGMPAGGAMKAAAYLNGTTLLQALNAFPTDADAGWTLFGIVLISDAVRALTLEANVKRARLVSGPSLSQQSHYLEVFRSGVRSVCGQAGLGVSTPEYPPYHFPVGAYWGWVQVWDPVTKTTGLAVNRGTPVYSPAGTTQLTNASSTLRFGGSGGPDSQHYMGPHGVLWGTGSTHSLLHPSRKADLDTLWSYLEMMIGTRQPAWA